MVNNIKDSQVDVRLISGWDLVDCNFTNQSLSWMTIVMQRRAWRWWSNKVEKHIDLFFMNQTYLWPKFIIFLSQCHNSMVFIGFQMNSLYISKSVEILSVYCFLSILFASYRSIHCIRGFINTMEVIARYRFKSVEILKVAAVLLSFNQNLNTNFAFLLERKS